MQYVDEDNFGLGKLPNMKTLVVDFLCDLYKTTIGVTEHDTNVQDELMEEICVSELVNDGQDTHYTEDEDDSDPFDDVYEKAFSDKTETKKEATKINVESIYKEKENELRDRITTQLELYIKHCEQLDIVLLLNEFGNLEYERNKSTIREKN